MAMIDTMMAQLGSKMGIDLSKHIDRPTMNGGNLEFKITEKQLNDIMNSKGGQGNIEAHIENGSIKVAIKIA